MQLASNFTITKGTLTGSEQAGFVDRTAAIRVISDLISALELQGVKADWPLDWAIIQAEVMLGDWGHERLLAPKVTAQ